MANRRMISRKIIDSARFLKMPISTQSLYFHLAIRADDDGVVEAWNIIRMIGCTEDDLKVLVAKGFAAVLNDDLVTFITDWNEHNNIRADRKIDSIYKDLLLQIMPDIQLLESRERSDKKKIIEVDGQGTADGQHRLGKDRLGKDSIGKDSIGKDKDKADKSAAEKPLSRQLTDYFCEKYLEKYNTKYQFEAKDGVLLNSLLKAFDIDFMKGFIDWFFTTDDKFIEQAGRNVGILKASRDKYVAHKAQQDKDRAALEKAAEIRRKADKLI